MTAPTEIPVVALAKNEKPAYVQTLEKFVPQFSDFLPVGVKPERVIAAVRLAVASNSKIAECTPASILQSVGRAMQLDLEIGVTAYLIPRNVWNPNTRQKEMTCTMLPDYRAHIEMIVRSGAARGVEAEVVREGDFFEYEKGLNKNLVHRPNSAPDAPITHAYAIVRLRYGQDDFVVLTRQEIEAIRAKSQGWNDATLEKKGEKAGLDNLAWYCKKSAVIRVTNLVPKNPRLAKWMRDVEAVDPLEIAGDTAGGFLPKNTLPRAPEGLTGYGAHVDGVDTDTGEVFDA
jgi:recombination protein RecT